MVLIFLKALRPKFSKVRPNVIGSSPLSSDLMIHITSHVKLFLQSQNPASVDFKNCSVGGRGSESNFEDRGRRRGCDGGRSGGRELLLQGARSYQVQLPIIAREAAADSIGSCSHD